LKLAYVGDAGNNMGNSYLIACATAGMSVSVAAPQGFQPKAETLKTATEIARGFGQTISVHTDPRVALENADVVATDTWISMGQEAEKAERERQFTGYTVNQALFEHAKSEAIFLHCLPAYRGYEVTAEVLDGPRSLIWQEAENRLHAQKGLMLWLHQQMQN
jgi:ornithine carbamoyltransferase